MSAKFKNFIKYTITLSLAGFLFWYAIRNMPLGNMLNDVRQADFRWISLTIAISLLSHFLRAVRWNMLLEPLGYKPKAINTFMAIMVGYFANIFVPRMGEVSRCAVLNKIENVHFNSAFGTVVAERIIDLLCLALLIGLSVSLEYKRFSDFFFNQILNRSKTASSEPFYNHPIVYIGLIIFFLMLITGLILRKKIIASLFYGKVKVFILGLIEGALSIRKLKNRGVFILYTFLIWFCYYLMTYLMFFAFPSTSGLDAFAGLVILIVSSLGMSAPVQGGIGAFHLLVSGALTLFYGLSNYQGTTYAVVIHASQFLTMFVVGGICALIVLFLKRKVAIATQNA